MLDFLRAACRDPLRTVRLRCDRDPFRLIDRPGMVGRSPGPHLDRSHLSRPSLAYRRPGFASRLSTQPQVKPTSPLSEQPPFLLQPSQAGQHLSVHSIPSRTSRPPPARRYAAASVHGERGQRHSDGRPLPLSSQSTGCGPPVGAGRGAEVRAAVWSYTTCVRMECVGRVC